MVNQGKLSFLDLPVETCLDILSIAFTLDEPISIYIWDQNPEDASMRVSQRKKDNGVAFVHFCKIARKYCDLTNKPYNNTGLSTFTSASRTCKAVYTLSQDAFPRTAQFTVLARDTDAEHLVWKDAWFHLITPPPVLWRHIRHVRLNFDRLNNRWDWRKKWHEIDALEITMVMNPKGNIEHSAYEIIVSPVTPYWEYPFGPEEAQARWTFRAAFERLAHTGDTQSVIEDLVAVGRRIIDL